MMMMMMMIGHFGDETSLLSQSIALELAITEQPRENTKYKTKEKLVL